MKRSAHIVQTKVLAGILSPNTVYDKEDITNV